MMTLFSRYKKLLFIPFALLFIYGAIRLYFAVTHGFTVGNITSDLDFDKQWSIRALSSDEQSELDVALNQDYEYLGKGCQAYVFASQDGQFVIKFFKYQRFRVQPWINALSFIPPIEEYRGRKAKQKKEQLDKLFISWKIAFDQLGKETGIAFVHLNKSDDLNQTLTIRDKIGLRHELNLDQMEFLVQRRAEMLCKSIKIFIANDNLEQGKQLIDNLLAMLLSEYARGYADNDHALMQNTGVIDGMPVHIDVGQFIYNDHVKDPAVFRQEIYDKTYKFHLWLEQQSKPLATHLLNRLIAIIGEDYFLKGPYVHKSDVAKIPHQERADRENSALQLIK